MPRNLILASSTLLGIATVVAIAGCTEAPAPVTGGDPAVLVRIDPEPSGATCPRGGSEIRTGHDRNGNGMLDDDEIEQSTPVCGAEPPTLVRIDAEPAGAHCGRGGGAVHTGPDRNGNGALDDDEIASTTYVCDAQAIYEGDFTFEQWHDAAAIARLRRAQVVTGSVALPGDASAIGASLPALELVGGGLRLDPGDAGAIALPALTQIGGNVDLASTSGAPSWPSLLRIGGDLRLTGSTIEDLSAPALQHVGGSLVTGDVAKLDLPALIDVGGTLSLSNGGTNDLGLPELRRVGAALDIQNNPTLTDLGGLASLEVVGGDVQILDDPALTTVALPHLSSIGTEGPAAGLVIARTPVRAIELPSLGLVYGDVVIAGPAIDELDLTGLARAGSLTVNNAPKLARLDLGHLSSLDWNGSLDENGLLVRNTAVTSLVLPALESSRGYLRLENDPALTELRLPALTSARGILAHVDCPALVAIAAPRLREGVEDIWLGSPITELDLRALRDVAGMLAIRQTQLAVLDLPSLETVRELDVSENAALVDLRGLPKLSWALSLFIRDNPALVSLAGLERIEHLDGNLELRRNGLRSLAGLSGLVVVGGDVDLTDEPGLTELDGLAGLLDIDGHLVLDDDVGLTSLAGLAHLLRVGGPLELARDGAVSTDEIAAFIARVHP